MGHMVSMRQKWFFLVICAFAFVGAGTTAPAVWADPVEKSAERLPAQNAPLPAEKSSVPPRAVYVQDFMLDADVSPRNHDGAEHRRLQRLHGLRPHTSPAEHARQLVDLMAASLVAELNRAGFQAQRLPSGSVLPPNGWLVGGVFTELDEGNRLKRAVIGFGSGASTMEVQVTVSDLATNPDAPFMLIGTVKDPKKMPGAIVSMNPYVAAGKFVFEKNAPEKDARQAAKKIAAEIRKASDAQQPQERPVTQPAPQPAMEK